MMMMIMNQSFFRYGDKNSLLEILKFPDFHKHILFRNLIINLIQNSPCRGCLWIGGLKGPSLPKMCYTYPTMIKLGTITPHLKKIKKYVNCVANFLRSVDICIFFSKN